MMISFQGWRRSLKSSPSSRIKLPSLSPCHVATLPCPLLKCCLGTQVRYFSGSNKILALMAGVPDSRAACANIVVVFCSPAVDDDMPYSSMRIYYDRYL